MNLPTGDKIKQTGATRLEKLVSTFAMIHSAEISFLFMSFKRLRLERKQIRQVLQGLEQLTSDTSLTLGKVFLKRAQRDFRVARRPCLATKSR